jgi:hypothetical protein
MEISQQRDARRRSTGSQPSFVAEELESRRLLSAWGGWPVTVGLNQSVANYPSVNGAGQTIAILDTGIDYTNPVFGRSGYGGGHKIVDGYNFVDNNGDFMDHSGHGTAVAAVAAGNGYTYRRHHYQGVASGANIVALKVDDGTGNVSAGAYEAALGWVIDHKSQYNITAVNISEGGNDKFTSKVSGSDYGDELAQLKAMGVFIAVSSGNDGWSDGVEYPAADPAAVAVGSVDLNGQISDFSDTGPDMDLLAPGNQVIAPSLDPTTQTQNIIYASGTSFSSPITAAASMLLKQISPRATVDDLVTTLQNTGTPTTDPDTGATYQAVNVFSAVSVTERYLARHHAAAARARARA